MLAKPLGQPMLDYVVRLQLQREKHVEFGSHSLYSWFREEDVKATINQDIDKLLLLGAGRLRSFISSTATSMTVGTYPGLTADELVDGFKRIERPVRVGNEIIKAEQMVEDSNGTIRLTGLNRGYYGTTPASHNANAVVRQLHKAGYWDGPVANFKHFYGDLADTVLGKLNYGINIFSLDGSEWFGSSMYGAFGQNLLMEKMVNSLNVEINWEAAASTPYAWHIFNRHNWGEVGENITRAHQRYRWANQAYFRRNLIPRMMGWWNIDDANEWRWALSKAAAFDAGFGFYDDQNRFGQFDMPVKREIRDWRNAQLAGSLDWPNRFVMQERDDYFKLDKVTHDRGIGPTWKLSDWAKSGNSEGARSNSRYLAPQLRGFPLTNLARDARVTVSGVLDASYDGGLAVDTSTGVAQGEHYLERISGSGEWAIAGSAPDKWIELAWDSPQKVRRIILFDREFDYHNVTASTLTFTHEDDSTTTQTVTGIPANGSPKIIDFPQKTLKKVRFTITASQGSQPGLAEFVVLGPSVHYQTNTLATGARVTGVGSGQAARVTDGVIAADRYATLTGTSATLDLGGQYYLNGLAVWHYFGDSRTYHDVVFEVADNADFNNSTIVFNNDTDNSLGLDRGTDAEYPESSVGKQVLFAPLPGRYLRLWSNGNTVNTGNHLTEVEVYGTGNGTTDVAAAGVTSSSAGASDIHPVDISQRAGNTESAGEYSPDNLIDKLGGNFTSDLWVTGDRGYPNYFTEGGNRPNPAFAMNLDGMYELSHLVVWGFPASTANEAARFVVRFSRDGGATYSSKTETVQTSAALGSGSARLPFSKSHKANFVRVTITANARGLGYSTVGDGDRVGLGELFFLGSRPPHFLMSPPSINLSQGRTEPSGNYDLDNLIDGSGLSTAPPTLENLDSVTTSSSTSVSWTTADRGYPNYFTEGSGRPHPRFIFRLGQTYTLSGLVIWGFPTSTANEAARFVVRFSRDGVQRILPRRRLSKPVRRLVRVRPCFHSAGHIWRTPWR